MADLKARNLIARDLFPIPENVSPEGLRCIQLMIPDDDEHLAIFAGALRLLTIWNSWQKDGTTNARDAANTWKAAMQLGMFDCEHTELEENECADFTTRAPVITWEPQNPFTQPEYIPDGYIAVPWIEVTAGSPLNLIGFAVGDVISGYLSPPVFTPALDEGLARFRVSVVGEGVVELHLLKIPGGGSVLITKDDNPLTAQFTSMNKDVVALPFDTVDVFIVEVVFDTPGAHHIDVSMLARFNDELIFLTYGGGLRKVVLCGFDEMGDFMDVRQNPELPCILEKSVDGVEWDEFANLRLCAPIIRRVGNQIQGSHDGVTFFTFPEADETTFGDTEPQWPPADVPVGESGACLAAENIIAMLQETVLHITNLLTGSAGALGLAAAIAGLLVFFIVPPAGAIILVTAFGLVALGAEAFSDGFEGTVYDEFKCIIYCHASSDGAFTVDEFDALVVEVNAKVGAGWDFIKSWLSWNGAVGLTRMASAAGITDGDCDDCTTCTWCYKIDFTISDQGWVWSGGAPNPRALYDPGVGWGKHPNRNDRITIGSPTFDPFNVTEIEAGLLSCTGVTSLNIGYGTLGADYMACSSNKVIRSVPQSGITSLGIDAVVTTGSSPRITYVILRGTGINPFGADNC